jgi:hypothetical protein
VFTGVVVRGFTMRMEGWKAIEKGLLEEKAGYAIGVFGHGNVAEASGMGRSQDGAGRRRSSTCQPRLRTPLHAATRSCRVHRGRELANDVGRWTGLAYGVAMTAMGVEFPMESSRTRST